MGAAERELTEQHRSDQGAETAFISLRKPINWTLASCLGSSVRVDAVRGLAPRIYEGGATSSLSWWRGESVTHISFTKKNEE